MSIDQLRYDRAKQKIMDGYRLREGIGTLSEKTVHAILKNYYEPDVAKQEISLFHLVADIFTGKEIMEIQTGNFFPLKKKLGIFLPHYPVTLIYPLPRKKWVVRINQETGELSEKRKSPKLQKPSLTNVNLLDTAVIFIVIKIGIKTTTIPQSLKP